MVTIAELSPERQQLSAMILELQSNRELSDELAKKSRVFRFTGGTIATRSWNISCVTHYLSRDHVTRAAVAPEFERYRAIINFLAVTQASVAASPGPRSLPARFAITNALDQALAEITPLGIHLEAAMKQALEANDERLPVH